MRAVATGSWYTLKLAFALIALAAIALPLSHFNAEMHGLAGGIWDHLVSALSYTEDFIARPIAGLFHVDRGSERYLWIKAMIPIDVAVLLWILPDPRPRDIEAPMAPGPEA